ncbi:MAG: alpha/beta hydrolase [Pseudomonadales bacterium]|nr:alpha/beta hydrolase [Pseudomonadales bacterium]
MALLSACSTTMFHLGDVDGVPDVLAKGETSSFWREQVQYPYPVQYASVKDASGLEWKMSYMDEYWGLGPKSTADTIVLIHGRGANAGYFSQMMKYCLQAGLRVVAVDLPKYGKSIAENTHHPVNLSLADSRTMVHGLLVDQLDVERATYLGHSMGGQWVLGYALEFPDVVDRLILESPYGLEEFPSHIPSQAGDPVPLFDPVLAKNLEAWKTVWDPLKHKESEKARSAREIEAYYYFQNYNAKTGEVNPGWEGYFLNKDIDTIYTTQVRQKMAKDNNEEFDRYLNAYVWDIYGMGVESRVDDAGSLFKRLRELQKPIWFVFGEKDPFLPATSLSGNLSLRQDVIKPAYLSLFLRGVKPLVSIYPNTAHVPHAEYPLKFAEDVIHFIEEGYVVSMVENPLKY